MKIFIKSIFTFIFILILILNPISARFFTLTYAVINDLDQKYFYRQIKNESSFYVFALSEKGAKGLGQIAPITYSSYLKYDFLVWIPFINLDIAAKYQKKLLSKYNNNYSISLAAYNWGEGNVNNFLREKKIDRKKLDPDKNYTYLFKNVPETYNYLNKILR